MGSVSKKNMLLLSGSRAAGGLPEGEKPGFLDFAEGWMTDFFADAIKTQKPVVFVPYARPSGMTEEDYFNFVRDRVSKMGITLVCAPETGITQEFLADKGGIFVGGGHTPTLLHKLQQTGSLQAIKEAVESGLPYMGSSAGTLITCPSIKTNNDMPCPANDVMDLRSLNLIKPQLNCHYMDNAMHDPKHQGETRDTRLIESCTFNPQMTVLGLYEGQALRVEGDKVNLLTSPNNRGTNTPVFKFNSSTQAVDRSEIECQVGVAQDVSRLFNPPAQGISTRTL